MPVPFDTVCLSHLPWDFVYQRPQHLLSRCAREHRVFYVEEPHFDAGTPRLDIRAHGAVTPRAGVRVVTPHVPAEAKDDDRAMDGLMQRLLDGLCAEHGIDSPVLWYYTPMALGYARRLRPRAVAYDCMDELSLFAQAPPGLRLREAALLEQADLVFTGGPSLYEAKRHRHPRAYLFPSSVDTAHFARARAPLGDPADQAAIGHPRLGFYGVLDERLDRDLVAGIADLRPDWHLVMVGPVAAPKFDPALLPRRPNIHYLGPKGYDELPAYLAGWDVALLPFAHNASTRFISPTKTPEYLAGGKPVVSTSIRDVVRPYGEGGLVAIADTAADVVAAAERYLREGAEDRAARVARADQFLARMSWDRTWQGMRTLIEAAIAARAVGAKQPEKGAALADAHAGRGDGTAAREAATLGARAAATAGVSILEEVD